jgi:hypothetical protein
MKIKLIIIILITLSINAVSAQRRYAHFINIFCVNVPDSISKKLEDAYEDGGFNAGKNVYNLINRNDYKFDNGIFSFQGRGVHCVRRVFIYNKKKLYIFNSIGAFNPIGFMKEYVDCITILKLSNRQAISYLKAVAEYLHEEYGNTYGVDFKLNGK